MNTVRVLAPDVIAKIAAGEAVERPASAVKEVLENAIDAGADKIEIHLKDAGKELIHIKDNGAGIRPADLQNIFQRHATSKIAAIEDLEKLNSMGFRGEALYSIAAVSDITLQSRTLADEGWQIRLRGGVRQLCEPMGLAQTGTDIKIAELFFNTPARRKFLKNSTAELNQILNSVLPYALIYPQKRFLLTHAGRTILDLRPAPSALDRAAAALNLPLKDLMETSQELAEENIRARMILGNINVQRPRRDLQFIFINDRPVESRHLNFNMNDVYKLILPPGVYGAFIVNIHLNPAHVDVNIHPTKREVRIKDEARVISLLRRMAEYQLMQMGQAKNISWENPGKNMWGPALKISGDDHAGIVGDVKSDASRKGQALESLPLDFQLFGGENDLRSKFGRARFIGSFLHRYLIFESDQTLLIVDQHAAQERIMYEKFKNQIEAAKVEAQPLLTPLLIKLTPQERIAWEERQETLNAAGLETTLFDEDTIAVQTQPLLLKNIQAVVRALLAGEAAGRLDHPTLARRACKASLVAGDKLDSSQADFQRRQLLECQDPFTCPHGRPTLMEITRDFLDRQFLRT